MAQTDKSKSTGSGPVSGFHSAQVESAGLMGQFGTAMLESFGRCGAEFADFMSTRLKEDVKTQHELLHCRDMEKLADIQARFIKTAIEQYSAETGKMIKMGNEMFEEALNRKTR